ncbi:MAG: hypothetical protein GY927_16495 [bacterium]|nr:hypothetical protein [bacterium]
MAKPNCSSQKFNRSSDMDDALFEALASSVPVKNTGPDPDDILEGVFEDDGGVSSEQSGKDRRVAVTLDGIDRQYAQQIMEIVRHQIGEQVDLVGAIKIALSLCPMNEYDVGTAFAETMSRKQAD